MPSEVELWSVCAAFGAQAVAHWLRAACTGAGARVQQHELLGGAAAGIGAVLYLAAASGISAADYAPTDGSERRRPFVHLLHLERALAMGLLLLNVAALARERRPPAVALAAAWFTQMGALYLGHFVVGLPRLFFLGAAAVQLLPLAATLWGAMGGRLRLSPLQTVYRFLSTWCVASGAGYCLAFLCCEVTGWLDSPTELRVYAALDYLTVGLGSLVVSCAGSDKQAPMLPGQEAELSLYPGPHNHGFYPNPDFYDDNL